MTPYCSRTGTRSTLDALRRSSNAWRLLVAATGRWDHQGFRYAIDNGAFTAFNKGHHGPDGFDAEKFSGVCQWSALQEHPPDWIVVPDLVASPQSAEFSRGWLSRVQEFTQRPLIAVQDGMSHQEADWFVDKGCGVFLGGSTEYKLATLHSWGAYCQARNCYFHVGRVNTANRIKKCQVAGADSFDGTSVAKFPSTLALLDRAIGQGAFCFT